MNKTGAMAMQGRRARRAARLCAAPAVLILLAACEPRVSNHGFAPQLADLQDIAAGSDTRGSVLRKLGRPSTFSSFESNSWYYEASRVETVAFYAPEVVERTVVSVKFDDAGLVTDVARFGVEDGQVIDLITRRTPTYGRELTILQQIFGNLGRFNVEDALPQAGGRPGGF